jgi:hypothetical protein
LLENDFHKYTIPENFFQALYSEGVCRELTFWKVVVFAGMKLLAVYVTRQDGGRLLNVKELRVEKPLT